MKTLEFAHRFYKIPSDTTDTRLLDVWVRTKNNISQDFLDYDTAYEGGHYHLEEGNYLILFLVSDGVMWTTLRRWTPEKEQNWRRLIGGRVNIQIIDEDEHGKNTKTG